MVSQFVDFSRPGQQIHPYPLEFPVSNDYTETRSRSCCRLYDRDQTPTRDSLFCVSPRRSWLTFLLGIGIFLFTQSAQIGKRAGIPDGVINIVTTQKNVNDVGKEMCENNSVKKVTFTGSTAVAKLLYKMSASTIKKYALVWSDSGYLWKISIGFPLKLEAIVPSLFSMMRILIRLSKVNLLRFIIHEHYLTLSGCISGAVLSKFRGSGQTCICANRIYVQSNVYAEFASRLTERVAAFKVGNGLEEGM